MSSWTPSFTLPNVPFPIVLSKIAHLLTTRNQKLTQNIMTNGSRTQMLRTGLAKTTTDLWITLNGWLGLRYRLISRRFSFMISCSCLGSAWFAPSCWILSAWSTCSPIISRAHRIASTVGSGVSLTLPTITFILGLWSWSTCWGCFVIPGTITSLITREEVCCHLNQIRHWGLFAAFLFIFYKNIIYYIVFKIIRFNLL